MQVANAHTRFKQEEMDIHIPPPVHKDEEQHLDGQHEDNAATSGAAAAEREALRDPQRVDPASQGARTLDASEIKADDGFQQVHGHICNGMERVETSSQISDDVIFLSDVEVEDVGVDGTTTTTTTGPGNHGQEITVSGHAAELLLPSGLGR